MENRRTFLGAMSAALAGVMGFFSTKPTHAGAHTPISSRPILKPAKSSSKPNLMFAWIDVSKAEMLTDPAHWLCHLTTPVRVDAVAANETIADWYDRAVIGELHKIARTRAAAFDATNAAIGWDLSHKSLSKKPAYLYVRYYNEFDQANIATFALQHGYDVATLLDDMLRLRSTVIVTMEALTG